jgi:hypothetical protein
LKKRSFCGPPTSYDHQALQANDRDKDSCREEVPKDFATHSDYSPTVQMWYDRIHAYLQLIRLKEGKAKNVGNVICFAVQTSIQTPDKLTMEELKDGLRYCRI